MGATNARRTVELDPERAWRLWTDISRWPTFVEGFAHAIEQPPGWPQKGSKLVWQSTPGGRGRVTEKVNRSEPGAVIATSVFEEALAGTQTATFERTEDGRTRVDLRLDYELTSTSPLKQLTDVLFIRRALGAALARTLARFVAEAAEEAAL